MEASSFMAGVSPFVSSRLMTGACASSSNSKHPYHKNCGCAIHLLKNGFKAGHCPSGSPFVVPVKSGKNGSLSLSVSAARQVSKLAVWACACGNTLPVPFDDLNRKLSDLSEVNGAATNSRQGELVSLMSEFANLVDSVHSDNEDLEWQRSCEADQTRGSMLETVSGRPAVDFPLVLCPLEGNFFRSPAPLEAPYVRVGDRVRKGQVLCVVDTLKLMTEIEADADGTVVDILAMDGMPVSVNAPLFVIRQ